MSEKNEALTDIEVSVGDGRLIFTAVMAGGRRCEIPAEDVLALSQLTLSHKVAVMGVTQRAQQQRSGVQLSAEQLASIKRSKI